MENKEGGVCRLRACFRTGARCGAYLALTSDVTGFAAMSGGYAPIDQAERPAKRLNKSVRQVRNVIMHTAKFEVTSAEVTAYLATITTLLQEPAVHKFPSARRAIVDIVQIETTDLDRHKPAFLMMERKMWMESVENQASENKECRWGTTDDLATSFLSSATLCVSLMLSSHLFLCLPRLLAPLTVPCRMVFVMLDVRQTCPYHFSFRLFTVVRRSS
ncbi:hypothetical protein LSAT2_011157 [Lamellibrachia satsuma]|nr:hypothetical protein LSAT2_011157 [Lamellibrachia satsuma]